jgi:N-acyl-D-amino-acid deacylase
MKSRIAALVGILLLGLDALGRTEEPDRSTRSQREAVIAGLGVVQKALKSYPEHRDCFSCHHQTLPMLAMVACRDAGHEIDEPLLAEATKFSHASFRGRINSLREGKNIGGRAMTVGYGLWTLKLGDAAADETSEAMVTYLLKTQESGGSWRPPSNRPPLEESSVMCTVLSAYYARELAGEAQRGDVSALVDKARQWLLKADVNSQEDRNSRLWGLTLLSAGETEIEQARQTVLDAQRDDGGWAQLDSMQSDAYATGQALYVLRASGLAADDAAYQRGVRFLLQTQQDDGSWFVETRSKPVQVFFDNGDPHGKSQFISIAATSWAVAALAAK